MADIQVPSIATATPAAADTVLGVQGGAVKRFTVNALPFTQDGTGAVARTALAKMKETVSVLDFGAVGDGITDDTAAIVAALAAADEVFLPSGTYLVSSTISIPQRKALRGSGYNSVLSADGIAGAVISITSGNGPTTVRDLRIAGTATTGLSVNGAQMLLIENISLGGLTATDGFSFKSTWGSRFSNLFTNGATLTNSCFTVLDSFNANECHNWYTSNTGVTYNVLVTDNGHGSAWSMVTCQGGKYGLYIKQYHSAVFNGVYTENAVFPLVLGDGTVYAYGITINCASLGGASSSHPNYAERSANVILNSAYGCSFNGLKLDGVYQARNWAPITFSGGGGSGAIAIARVTAGGAVHSVEVINPGSGYTSDPTASVGGAGSGAVLTVTRSSTTVGAIAVAAGGAGYTPGACPVAIMYYKAQKCVFTGTYLNDGAGNNYPVYPWVVSANPGDNGCGVTIHGDQSYRSGQHGTAQVQKTNGYAYKHAVIEYNTSGVQQVYVYTPPLYP